MSNQTKDRKISKFLGQTALPSGAYLTYIFENTNYKIIDSDFYASLGVTGTIVQDGAVTGTPVLDKAGSVNNIRNIEAGSGIKSSVSPENGLTIEHDFIEDSSGVTVVVDLTADRPKFRSIIAGSGMNVSASNGQIQVALSGIPATTKTVIVNDINDFPAAVSGVITLESNTEYAIRNDITTANRFILGDNCILSGSDNAVVNLTYTNSGTMFTGVNKTVKFKDITITCSSGTFISFSGTGAEIFQILGSVIVADIVGSIGDALGVQIGDSQMTCTTDGLTFSGTNGVALIRDGLHTINGGTLFDLGSATFDGISFKSNFNTLASGTFYLGGAASSANLTSGGLGTVVDCRFFGSGTPLSTVTADDDQWQFSLNDSIEDTHNDAMLSLVNNAAETVISAINTPTLILGTWNQEHSTHFTINANGRATYTGVKDQSVSISFAITATVASGSNKTIAFYIAKNGTKITNTEARNIVSSSSEGRTSQVWIAQVTNGDFFEIFAENQTDAINIIASHAAFRVD